MKQVIMTAVAMSIVATPALAADSANTNKHEAAGLGSGLVIGAAIGGPVGAIFGAAFGALIGDKYHEERTARVEVEAQYELARADVDSLRSDAEDLRTQLSGSERRIAAMQRSIREDEHNYRAAVQEALNDEIFFRTGESDLSEQSVEKIGRIATLVASMDGFVIRLAGHADSRGGEDYNEELSAARAVAVRDALITAGFPDSRIVLSAEGESAASAAEEDLDALAMERRVQILLVPSDSDSLVAVRP